MLRLEPLTTAKIPLLPEFLSRYPRQSWDYNIGNLLTGGKI